MGALQVLIITGIIVFLVYRFGKAIFDRRLITTDDHFQQKDVKIDYAKRTITIRKHIYNVDQVTGIRTSYNTGNSNFWHHVEIEMDDLRKPVHRIAFFGERNLPANFSQRLCVALRKAGGPDFS